MCRNVQEVVMSKILGVSSIYLEFRDKILKFADEVPIVL